MFDAQKALLAGQFVAAAYGDPYQPLPAGYRLETVIFGNDLATDKSGPNAIPMMVPFGFVAYSPGPTREWVVAIRGTDNIWEWLQDARYGKHPCPINPNAGETEDGFTDVYYSLTAGEGLAAPPLAGYLQDLLPPNHGGLTIAGHSLGGALATLLALDMADRGKPYCPSLYTFGSPLVGDAAFAAYFNQEVPNSWRVVTGMDLVPLVPPLLAGFAHVNQEVRLPSRGIVKPNPTCQHALNSYFHLLDGGPASPLSPACCESNSKPTLLEP